jgi:hypothetical protein
MHDIVLTIHAENRLISIPLSHYYWYMTEFPNEMFDESSCYLIDMFRITSYRNLFLINFKHKELVEVHLSLFAIND